MAKKGNKPTLGPAEKFNELHITFGTRPLAKLMRTRASHLLGFETGEMAFGKIRMERLNFLHAVTSKLKGSFNDIGINQWFDRSRHTLGHQTPRQILEANPWRATDGWSKRISRMATEATNVPRG